jgi:formylmethanofuran dehydrogenase subunit E
VKAVKGPPATKAVLVTDTLIRCSACGKLLLEQATRPWALTCPRCKTRNQSGSSP